MIGAKFYVNKNVKANEAAALGGTRPIRVAEEELRSLSNQKARLQQAITDFQGK